MSEPESTTPNMTDQLNIWTVWTFLRGDHQAILRIASARGALGVGLLFVLSAALAREYDGVDLWAEPWHLVVPLAASLGTSLLLFILLYGVGRARRMGSVPFGRTYLRFLALYWLTAPLAWLYAIPVETFMTPLGATLTNLALLGVVSFWRVWLITRAVQCLFNVENAALPVVLLFADVVVLAALQVVPIPVVSIMGGIRHSDAEIAVLGATFLISLACLLSLPIWLFSTVWIAAIGKKWQFALTPQDRPPRPTRGLWSLAVASVVAWVFVLPMTQPEQHLAHRVDEQLRAGKLAEAINEMAAHVRGDFPARWDPPPHIGYGDRHPPLLDVMEAVVAVGPPPWVWAIYTEKFGSTLYNADLLWPGRIDDKQFSRYVQLLLRLPEGPAFAAREEHWLRLTRDNPEHSETRRADLDTLLELAKSYDPKRDPSIED